jgi:hypothetical protein
MVVSVKYFSHAKVLRVGKVILSQLESAFLIANARASHDKSYDTLLGKVNRALDDARSATRTGNPL